ncbi:MAG: carboxypeptidase-like regulatory domain-containing protein [Bacteroidales bacterium]|nr:carboxypeptidase-like regulatory domain-containing protein [Bacteroidales bacterium]MDT8430834.1 carboxypeptidase-like regulatory domain-containing protein [Bacteroidales bacterium]
MKTMKQLLLMLVLMLAGVIQTQAGIHFPGEDETTDTTLYIVYTGKVVDASDNTPLPFATIEGKGVNFATVTNIDGEFTLKVPRNVTLNNIKISYVGYKNNTVGVAAHRNLENRTIRLEPTSVNLQEVTVRAEDALGLIQEVLTKINDNYSTGDMMMTAFYRETIKKRRNYVSISEAVVDIFKAAYSNDFKFDQVKLLQGRKSADVEKMDTILFKVQGGPVTTLLLDIVKNPYLLLSDQYQKVYNFYITGVISLNDRLHYVVSFNQKPHVTSPFYNGKLYIDMDKLAITEAEFELNMENEMEVASMFIRKKPAGVNVIPERAAYRTKYTIEDDNTWYFSYARAEVKFDVKWDRKLFKTQYSTMSEIAITDRQEESVDKFPFKERYKRSQVLDELVYVFFDQDFWKGYNVIEPDQSIESAIEKLNRRFLKTPDSAPAP